MTPSAHSYPSRANPGYPNTMEVQENELKVYPININSNGSYSNIKN